MTDSDLFGPPEGDVQAQRGAAPNTISVEQYREILKKQSNSRGNDPTTIDGHTFDSKAEAKRYGELKLMVQAGEISDLTVHPVYELQTAFRDATGSRHRSIRYEGDFGYTERGRAVVEDVKGHRTEVFKLKEKLFRFRYPYIDFRVLDIR